MKLHLIIVVEMKNGCTKFDKLGYLLKALMQDLEDKLTLITYNGKISDHALAVVLFPLCVFRIHPSATTVYINKWPMWYFGLPK